MIVTDSNGVSITVLGAALCILSACAPEAPEQEAGNEDAVAIVPSEPEAAATVPEKEER